MTSNIFIPTALSLLSSYSLTLTSIEYRHAHELLAHSQALDAQELRAQLEDALRHIEQELTARGHSTSSPDISKGLARTGAPVVGVAL